MKGLLWKDVLQMRATMKSLLFVMGCFIVVSAFSHGGISMEGFAILFAAMMPVNALGLDEKAKWNQYELCMPVSRKTIVWEKYVFGIGACVLTGGASLLLRAVACMFIPGMQMNMIFTFTSIGIGIGFLSINLPVMFRFGVEKGRMVYIVLFAAFYGIAGAVAVVLKEFGERAFEMFGSVPAEYWVLAGVLLFSLMLVVSVIVSVRVYEKREL